MTELSQDAAEAFPICINRLFLKAGLGPQVFHLRVPQSLGCPLLTWAGSSWHFTTTEIKLVAASCSLRTPLYPLAQAIPAPHYAPALTPYPLAQNT